MDTTTVSRSPAVPVGRPGLHELANVVLAGEFTEAYDRLAAAMLGPREWIARKRVELRELLALAQIAHERMRIVALDALTDIRAIVILRCSVPRLSAGESDLRIGSEAHLAIRYGEAVIRQPTPGTSMVEILQPNDVFLPNVAPGGANPSQTLCLGVRIPRGMPLREAVLSSYAALTLQSIQPDELHAAGVLHLEAGRFWQEKANSERIPLSAEPFLGAGS